jgi:uncharacterized protein YijF (DUF1287 family)
VAAIGMNRFGSRGISNLIQTGPMQTLLHSADGSEPPVYRKVKPRTATAAKIVKSARSQIGSYYYAAYVSLPYPNGDVPPMKNGTMRGACTDVIIRALRAVGYDLQKLIHEDMQRSIASYPRRDKRIDPNIDHRRVPNQMAFLDRHGLVLTKTVSSSTLNQWQPGDIVFWDLGGPLHTGIVSDSINSYGEPLVIHNMGLCAEEDRLTAWKIIGHYRYPVNRQTVRH